MIIFPRWEGRFGNQLFQYCFGRILNLMSGRAVFFPEEFAIDLWRPANVTGAVYTGTPLVYRGGQKSFNWSLLRRRTPLEITGYFEDYRYYAPYRAEIRSWLPLPQLPFSDPNEIVVHLRRTDFRYPLRLGRLTSAPRETPFNLLVEAIESFGIGPPVRIVTDEPNDSIVLKLAAQFAASIVSGPPKADFLTLCAAKSVVMSESTFSWWATFLGNPLRVVCPLRERSPWFLGGKGNPDFPRPMITDDPRFEYPIGNHLTPIEPTT